MATFIEHYDEHAAALACRKLRDAVLRAEHASARRRSLETRVRSLAGSLGKLRWGVAGARAPLSTKRLVHVTGLGELRMLSWLCARLRVAVD